MAFVGSFAISTVRARRLTSTFGDVRRETGYTPVLETVWPEWARKLFFAYLGIVILLFVAVLILLIAAAVAERFG